jgi:mRNA interferase RelE/StbE
MKVEFASIFAKDLKKITDHNILFKFRKAVLDIERTDNLFELDFIKKLIGSKNAYRIRIKDYRVGFYIINNVILFKRILHRKDIYKYFP